MTITYLLEHREHGWHRLYTPSNQVVPTTGSVASTDYGKFDILAATTRDRRVCGYDWLVEVTDHQPPPPQPGSPINLASMSQSALAAMMNALNPSPEPFRCRADQHAFSEISCEIARRFAREHGISCG